MSRCRSSRLPPTSDDRGFGRSRTSPRTRLSANACAVPVQCGPHWREGLPSGRHRRVRRSVVDGVGEEFQVQPDVVRQCVECNQEALPDAVFVIDGRAAVDHSLDLDVELRADLRDLVVTGSRPNSPRTASTCVSTALRIESAGLPSRSSSTVVLIIRSGVGTKTAQVISTIAGSTYRATSSRSARTSSAMSVNPATMPRPRNAETRHAAVSVASRSEPSAVDRNQIHVAIEPAVVITPNTIPEPAAKSLPPARMVADWPLHEADVIVRPAELRPRRPAAVPNTPHDSRASSTSVNSRSAPLR